MADFLLQHNYNLTALEFHQELVLEGSAVTIKKTFPLYRVIVFDRSRFRASLSLWKKLLSLLIKVTYVNFVVAVTFQ